MEGYTDLTVSGMVSQRGAALFGVEDLSGETYVIIALIKARWGLRGDSRGCWRRSLKVQKGSKE